MRCALVGRAAAAALGLVVESAAVAQAPATGPLTVHPQNPRYFANGNGQAVYLTGSHTWTNLADEWTSTFNVTFDYNNYLNVMQHHHHNFIRLWRAEMPRYRYNSNSEFVFSAPHPWVLATAGGGGASGGGHGGGDGWGGFGSGKTPSPPTTPSTSPSPGGGSSGSNIASVGVFNLQQFNATYFNRLRERCIAARDRGIYVSIMLFEGHALQFTAEGWNSHPFNALNNTNGINGDPNNDGRGLETHTLANPAITAIQEAYVRKVIDTLNDLDNVMYEISNEDHVGSIDWQNHFIDYIQQYELTKPKRHPVLFSATFPYAGEAPWVSNAQAVSPLAFSAQGSYGEDPPAATGSKVVLCDSDHIFGCGSDSKWVWKCFTRGLNPIYMDSWYSNTPFCQPPDYSMRTSMGYTRDYALRMNLALSVPRNDLASTGYCLANVGTAYLVYLPNGGTVNVDLTGAGGNLFVEWFNPQTGVASNAGTVAGGAVRTLSAPFSGHAAVFVHNGTGPPPPPTPPSDDRRQPLP